MGSTLDLGRRIELVPMDPHFHDISIGLYRLDRDTGLELTVHSYSRREGTRDRLEFVVETMTILGGMERIPGEELRLRFPSGLDLPVAAKRVFLEACKCPSGTEVIPKPLHIFDKKSRSRAQVAPLGRGLYEVSMETDSERSARRAKAIAAGIAKLSGASVVEAGSPQIAFPKRQSVDALVGLLLIRALNVRAAIREQESTASRGVLSSPSARNN